jgi:hypothetical protein
MKGVYIRTEEIRKKNSDALKGKPLSLERKEKMRVAHKGLPGHPHSKETREKIRNAKLGKSLSVEHRKRLSEVHKGRHHSEETKRRIGRANKGKHRSEEFGRRMSEIHKGKYPSAATRKRQSESHKKQWQDPAFKRRNLEAIFKGLAARPTYPERQLDALLKELFHNEYKYVGDGQVIMAGKCPDFINVNGQKKIIELFGRRWHKTEDELTRVNTFAPFGYETLIVWSEELQDVETLKRKLIDFTLGGFNAEAG